MILLLLYLAYAIALSVGLARVGFRHRTSPTPGAPPGSPSRILIVGASGGTGRELVAKALARGFVVTALVRNPSRLPVEHARLTVLRGDVRDHDSVMEAMRDQEAVLSALGHRRFFYPNRILSEGTRNILRAMEEHGVRRFVCQTTLGIGDSSGRMGLLYTLFVIPVVLPFYFWDKTRQERVIAASSTDWVIVRPGALTKGGARGLSRHGLRVGNFLTTVSISRVDVADFMLNQLASNTYLGCAPGVCRG